MPRRQYRFSLILLACALALRMLVPVGWMPAPSGGAFALEPCPAAGEAPVISMAAHHHESHHQSHKAGHDGECAFSPLTVAFAGYDVPLALLPIQLDGAAAPGVAVAPFFPTGPPAPPPPSTGPPALT